MRFAVHNFYVSPLNTNLST